MEKSFEFNVRSGSRRARPQHLVLPPGDDPMIAGGVLNHDGTFTATWKIQIASVPV